MQAPLVLAQQVADRLGQIEGVAAVVLGGSWARGAADAKSDLDIALYYHPDKLPSLDALRQLAAELDDQHRQDVVTEFGGWGEWINGGAWLEIQGQRVDWLYRDLQRVESTVAECEAGESRWFYQPGHPHGWFTHIYVGELFYCRPLYDPQNSVANLKRQVEIYPPKLKAHLLQKFLWEAEFSLDISHKSVERGESFYVAGCFFRCIAGLVQALYALNERYIINEKGALNGTENFARCPENFKQIANQILAAPGASPDELRANLARLEKLVAEVKTMAS